MGLVPGHPNVSVFAAGWAFKFVPLVGKFMAEYILDGKLKNPFPEWDSTRPGIFVQLK